MANTRSSIISALATELTALDEITLATQYILPVDKAEAKQSYVGIVAGEEVKIIEDATDICYNLPIHLFIICEQQYHDVEVLIDTVKNAIHNSAEALTLTNNVQAKTVLSTNPVELEEYDSERFSNVQIDLMIRYYVTKTDI